MSFASRSLNESEKRYAQIEKEMLAICFGLEKFHQFVYGRQVQVYTDHKPLVSIVQKDMNKVTARLQRLKLKLLKYKINVEYLPGKQMVVADLLSRSFLESSVSNDDSHNEMVHSLNTEVSISQARLIQFRQESVKDTVLVKLRGYVLEGWPEGKHKVHEDAKQYGQ